MTHARMIRHSGDKTVTLKTIALAATAAAAIIGAGAAFAQTVLPSIATPPPSADRTLVHAGGYSITIPTDWLVSTDGEGIDFTVGSADLTVICQTFHQSDVLNMTDDEARAGLTTENLGETIFTKLLFGDAPELTYVSTSIQADHPGGWPFQRAVATAVLDSTPSTSYAFVTFKQKGAFYGGCFTPTKDFEARKAEMDQFINAIRMTK